MNSFKTQKKGRRSALKTKKGKKRLKKQTKRGSYINLTNDIVFQYFFKKDEAVLKSLLKAFLPLPDDKSIQQVQVLDSLSLPDQNIEDKCSVFDMKLKLNTGEKINVEMQSFSGKYLLKRVIFYLSRLYTEGLEKGKDYDQLPSSYSLIFTKVNVFKQMKEFYSTFSLRLDRYPYCQLNDSLNVIFVELAKFKKKEVKRLFDLREEWCYILKKSSSIKERDLKELSQRGLEMKTAVERVKKLSKDEKLRIIEEKREKGRWIYESQMAYARNKGIKQGLEQGIEQGRIDERQIFAKRLLQSKFNNTEIVRLTGLTEKEVCQIRKKLKK